MCLRAHRLNYRPLQGGSALETPPPPKFIVSRPYYWSVPWDQTKYERIIDELLDSQDDDYRPSGEVTRQSLETHFLDEPEEIAYFSLDEVRKFPRYITDLTIKSNPSIISADHFAFWAWTGAVLVPYPLRTNGHYSHNFTELASLIHTALFRVRENTLTMEMASKGDEPSALHPYTFYRGKLNMYNPSHLSISNFANRILATTGFSVLDGLVKCHCPTLVARTGEISNSYLEAPWRPNSEYMGDGKSPNYHDRLQIWKEYKATEAVSQTLEHINDLTRYDPRTIERSIDGVKSRLKDELTTTNHFFRLLHEQRDDNIHGSQGTRAIGSIVLTLCCLVFWDLVKPDEYERHRRYSLREIRNWEDGKLYTPLSPDTFLPLIRMQKDMRASRNSE